MLSAASCGDEAVATANDGDESIFLGLFLATPCNLERVDSARLSERDEEVGVFAILE